MTTAASNRIHMVDALRGMAVMAILLVHCLEHYIYPVYPADPAPWLKAVDDATFGIVFTLFAGKAYAIFALLFGFTFFIQSHNQEVKGRDFGPRFLWRMVLLLGFATLNAAFFPAGDVLLLFAIVGVVLFIVRRWSNRALLWAALFFLLQPVEWYHIIASLIDSSHQLPDLKVDDMYNEVAEYTKAGNFWQFIWINITLGQKASLLWAVNAGRFMQTAGLFILGFYIGRRSFFTDSAANRRFWTLVLITAAIAFAPLHILQQMIATDYAAGTAGQMLAVIFDMWQKFAFTAVLVGSFYLLFYGTSFGAHTSALRFYGRMSLTNYIGQSIIGALIFFPFALSLAPYCGYTLSLLIGVAVCALQVAFSRWWLRSHRQGPLESLWHRLTWL